MTDLPAETTGLHDQLIGVLTTSDDEESRTAVITTTAYRDEQVHWRYVSIVEQYLKDGQWKDYQDEGVGCAPDELPLLIALLQRALDGLADTMGGEHDGT